MQFRKAPLFWSLVGFLAVWRITNIIQKEEIASPIRKAIGITEVNEDPNYWLYPDNFIGKLFFCFWCGSMWVSAAVTGLMFIFPPLALPFAFSAGAIAFKEWLERPSVTYIENYWTTEGPEEYGDLGEDDAGQ
jgi:hypothetical protein